MKKLSKRPKVKIDLHGFTIQHAFVFCHEELKYHKSMGHKSAEVITGKSGQIRKEFPIWLETWGMTGTVASHGGSFTVYLK
jgi:DNA-nicking Smr family endonuclease